MKRMLAVLFSLIAVFAFISLAVPDIANAMMAETGVSELTKEADTIVRGTVQSMKSEWNDDKTYIWSFVVISVEETIKGKVPGTKEITIKNPGGEVGEIGMRTSTQADFKVGDEVLLFLTKEIYKGKELFQVNRQNTGKFTIKDNKIIENQKPVDTFLNEVIRAMKK